MLKWKPDRDADRHVISRHLCVSDGKGGGGGKRGGGKDWWSRLQKVRHACTNIKVKLLYSFITLTEKILFYCFTSNIKLMKQMQLLYGKTLKENL